MSELPLDALGPGTRLKGGAFVITGLLGQGGFGTTYRAVDTGLQREVAAKELFPQGCAREGTEVRAAGSWSEEALSEARQRFLNESRALAAFEHPSIVRVFSHFEENNTAYTVMELVRGEALGERVKRTGPMGEQEARAAVEQVGEALQHIHNAGLLHRDVNPSNIMLDEEGRFILIDFGTAREFANGLTHNQSVILTPGFAPMEQYAQRARRGPFTDMYALGATLYFLLSGRQPTPATDRAIGADLPPLESLRPDLAPATLATVRSALEMKPEGRPQNANDLIAMLCGATTPTLHNTTSAGAATAPIPTIQDPADARPSDGVIDPMHRTAPPRDNRVIPNGNSPQAPPATPYGTAATGPAEPTRHSAPNRSGLLPTTEIYLSGEGPLLSAEFQTPPCHRVEGPRSSSSD